jgi:hypothetical protein
MDWPFQDPPNVAVFSSKAVINEGQWIHYVSHDEEDGAWQFHSIDGAPASDSDARVVSLRSMLQRDDSIRLLADLPLGWCAWRQNKDAPWQREDKPKT